MKILSMYLLSIVFVLSGCKSKENKSSKIDKPNIVFIYMDDLGYGDVGAYGATEINTPNMDMLAQGGIKFTNGYSSSATCTPSRYALLTGSYPWRNKGAKILPSTAPLLIDTETITLPKMLKAEGYQTAVVGKWHLGLGNGNVDWNTEISPGPNQVGFDYSYIMAATQDRVPTVYLENGLVEGLDPNDPIDVSYKENFSGEPTGYDHPELVTMKADKQHNKTIVNGIPRIGYMKGGREARWSDIDMADHFLQKTKDYLKRQKENKKPFFLFYAMQQPHVPRTPHPRFEGKSGLGPRGDAIVEADWTIGQFTETLEEEGLLQNTLIVFSSDNGPILNDGYTDQAVELIGDHEPSGILRGSKYSLYEAGTRVPFIIYWKNKIEPDVSNAIVSQIDLFSSLASLVGSDQRKQDSKDLLSVFLGKKLEGRKNYVLEAMSKTAFRQGDWLMIPPYKGKPMMWGKNIETGNSQNYQLYNLKEDPKQQINLAETNVIKLNELITAYENIVTKEFKSDKVFVRNKKT